MANYSLETMVRHTQSGLTLGSGNESNSLSSTRISNSPSLPVDSRQTSANEVEDLGRNLRRISIQDSGNESNSSSTIPISETHAHYYYDDTNRVKYPVTEQQYELIEQFRIVKVQEVCIRDIVAKERIGNIHDIIKFCRISRESPRNLRVLVEEYHAKNILGPIGYTYAQSQGWLLPYNRP